MGFHHIPKPPRVVALGGPVTRALRAMHAADAEHRAEIEAERARVRALRRAISDRIEADIALLDTLDAITEDLEDGGDDDREFGDDNGIADPLGLAEQECRHVGAGGRMHGLRGRS